MPRHERNGKRKYREHLSNRRIPKLGYYFIVTDTKETEQNYINGLRDSMPKELQGKLVIRIVKTKTKNLVEEAINLASLNPQYGEPWIIFDRDQVQDFDEIISQAKRNGIKVGWSNPCIEAWFSAYFGSMPTYQDSVSCCAGFGRTFEQISGQRYVKSDREIYGKLNRFGDEMAAIELAQRKYEEHKANRKDKPTKMCPCTTVHQLVGEIKSKIS
ncbi:MAG: RloB domain-containing protein [Clostridia bacterium]|nr:RloB domain-containing protein [Clostridia bacterium]